MTTLRKRDVAAEACMLCKQPAGSPCVSIVDYKMPFEHLQDDEARPGGASTELMLATYALIPWATITPPSPWETFLWMPPYPLLITRITFGEGVVVDQVVFSNECVALSEAYPFHYPGPGQQTLPRERVERVVLQSPRVLMVGHQLRVKLKSPTALPVTVEWDHEVLARWLESQAIAHRCTVCAAENQLVSLYELDRCPRCGTAVAD